MIELALYRRFAERRFRRALPNTDGSQAERAGSSKMEPPRRRPLSSFPAEQLVSGRDVQCRMFSEDGK